MGSVIWRCWSRTSQPRQTFDGSDLYPDLVSRTSVLGFLLISNHPFVDGNKRIGHAAMEAMLILNGFELAADVDEAEILAVVAGSPNREAPETWVRQHVVTPRPRLEN